jgi:hypothetical protein
MLLGLCRGWSLFGSLGYVFDGGQCIAAEEPQGGVS